MKRAFFTISLNFLESTSERLYQKITELIIQNEDHLVLTDPPRQIGISDVKVLEVIYDDGRDITFKLITDSDAFLLSTAYGTSKECCDCIDLLKKLCDKFEKKDLVSSRDWEEICSSQIGVKENESWEEICSSQIVGDECKKSEVNIDDGEKVRIELNKKIDDYYMKSKENIITTTTTDKPIIMNQSYTTDKQSYTSTTEDYHENTDYYKTMKNNEEELQSKVNDIMKTLQSLSAYTKSSKIPTNIEERAIKLQENITNHGKRIEEFSNNIQHQQTQMRREMYILATLILIFLIVFL